MRVVLFIVYLYSFLLGDTQHGLQEQSNSHVRFAIPQQFTQVQDNQHLSKAQHGVFIDDADVVLEEENISGGEVRDNAGKFLFVKYFQPVRFFNQPAAFTGTDYRLTGTKATPPFSGTSSPIYIKQRVLRI